MSDRHPSCRLAGHPDIMAPAWLGCMHWAIGQPKIVDAFRKETGTLGAHPTNRPMVTRNSSKHSSVGPMSVCVGSVVIDQRAPDIAVRRHPLLIVAVRRGFAGTIWLSTVIAEYHRVVRELAR